MEFFIDLLVLLFILQKISFVSVMQMVELLSSFTIVKWIKILNILFQRLQFYIGTLLEFLILSLLALKMMINLLNKTALKDEN